MYPNSRHHSCHWLRLVILYSSLKFGQDFVSAECFCGVAACVSAVFLRDLFLRFLQGFCAFSAALLRRVLLTLQNLFCRDLFLRTNLSITNFNNKHSRLDQNRLVLCPFLCPLLCPMEKYCSGRSIQSGLNFVDSLIYSGLI